MPTNSAGGTPPNVQPSNCLVLGGTTPSAIVLFRNLAAAAWLCARRRLREAWSVPVRTAWCSSASSEGRKSVRSDEVEISRSASFDDTTPTESESCCARESSDSVCWAGSCAAADDDEAAVSGARVSNC